MANVTIITTGRHFFPRARPSLAASDDPTDRAGRPQYFALSSNESGLRTVVPEFIYLTFNLMFNLTFSLTILFSRAYKSALLRDGEGIK